MSYPKKRRIGADTIRSLRKEMDYARRTYSEHDFTKAFGAIGDFTVKMAISRNRGNISQSKFEALMIAVLALRIYEER